MVQNSRCWEDHLRHLRITLQILQDNKLVIKLPKCSFAEDKLQYLGHITSENRIAIDKEKTKAVLEWPQPQNIKALRGFLGLSGYYEKFIRGYGMIAKPLTSMLKKNSFWLIQDATDAFYKLKSCLINPPILAMSNFNKEFIIERDASGLGIGALLLQDNKPIAYISQGLQGINLQLSTYEKEFLALILPKKAVSIFIGHKIYYPYSSSKFTTPPNSEIDYLNSREMASKIA